jgi:hypothetical protein
MLPLFTPYPPMKNTVSPRTVVFLLLGLLCPFAAGNQERHTVKNTKSAPVAEYYLPAPAKSVANARVASPDDHGTTTSSFRSRAVQRKVSSRELTRYEVDPQSFSKGLAAVSAAQRQASGR